MLVDTKPQNTQIVVELLKRGLKDTNKQVRKWAAEALLRMDVSDECKRKNFIPLISELFHDRSKRVRRYLSQEWILGKYAVDFPVEVVAEALLRETDPNTKKRMQSLLLKILDAKKRND